MNKNTHVNNLKFLLKTLKICRKNSNITQKQLADKLHIAQSLISKIETGERKIDVIELIEISKAIGCNPIEIFTSLVNNWIDE